MDIKEIVELFSNLKYLTNLQKLNVSHVNKKNWYNNDFDETIFDSFKYTTNLTELNISSIINNNR